MTERRKKVMRSFSTCTALTILAVTAYYSVDLAKRDYHAGRMTALVKNFEKIATSRRTKMATRQYLRSIYWPEIIKERKAFLDSVSYWKMIYAAYYAAAMTFARERNEGRALGVLRRGMSYHPFFPNGYELIGQIYENLGIGERAVKCRTVFNSLVEGTETNHAAGCECLAFEGCSR